MMPALVREGRLTGFAMRYLGRLVAYLAVFFITFSLGYTLLLRWVPVTLTPLKAIRLAEHLPEEGLRVRSNWVPLRKVAMPMVRAVIATEDNHFLSHRGFDWDAIDRALDENREGKRLRGGITISQQTAKNLFLWDGRSWLRKGLEAGLTLGIETVWSKKRILTVYLNIAEFGDGVFGVEAAAQRYFHKPASRLSLSEAALLAAVLPNPLRFKANAPSGYVRNRQAWIMRQMRQLGGESFMRENKLY